MLPLAYARSLSGQEPLLFPVTAAALLLALLFIRGLRQSGHFDTRLLVLLTIVCLAGAQIKYSFLPVFMAIGLTVIYFSTRWFWSDRQLAARKIGRDVAAHSKVTIVVLAGALLLTAGMFSWRYGYNVVQYGDINPDCNQVLSVKACMTYGVWARNYQLGLQHTPAYSLLQFGAFLKAWVHIMGDELVTVIGNTNGTMVNPVRQLAFSAALIGTAGILFIGLQWRRLKQAGYPMALFAAVCVAYLGTLMVYNYADYTHYGIPVAIQGRYLLPILPLLIIIGAQAYSYAFRKLPQVKAYIVIAAVVISTQGGGMITYLLRANSSWYWEAASVQQIQPIRQLGSIDSSRG